MIIILMGVCGSGKSTIGKILSKILDFQFIEGDSFHSKENIKKMSSGLPLTESDRIPWLKSIRKEMEKNLFEKKNCVITCSALSKRSRNILKVNQYEIKLVYLHASKSLIAERMAKRKNHFMPSGLLESQFKALEKPNKDEAIHIRVDQELSDITNQITKKVGIRI